MSEKCYEMRTFPNLFYPSSFLRQVFQVEFFTKFSSHASRDLLVDRSSIFYDSTNNKVTCSLILSILFLVAPSLSLYLSCLVVLLSTLSTNTFNKHSYSSVCVTAKFQIFPTQQIKLYRSGLNFNLHVVCLDKVIFLTKQSTKLFRM